MYASLKTLLAGRRPLVTAVTLPGSDDELQVFLIRRLSLLEELDAGVWSQPVTRLVRALMGQGQAAPSIGGGGFTESEAVTIAKSLITTAVIVPPEDVAAGLRDHADITRAECRPMFAIDNPEPGQAVIMEYGEFDRYAADLDDKVIAGEVNEAERDRLLGQVVPMYFDDLLDLGDEVMATGVGSLARFRERPSPAARSVAGVAGKAVKRPAHQRATSPGLAT